MPQLNKGGKFVFGFSVMRDDLTIHIPPQALSEYIPFIYRAVHNLLS